MPIRIEETISEILKSHSIQPKYQYQKDTFKEETDLIVYWKYYYSTPAVYKGKKVFLKILINDFKKEDFIEQIEFFKYVDTLLLSVFHFPKIVEYSLDPMPWIMFEYKEGDVLGYLDGPKDKYADYELFNIIDRGCREYQETTITEDKKWRKVKDFPWFNWFIGELEERVTKTNGFSIIRKEEFVQMRFLLKKFENEITIDYFPTFGDVNPGNIIIGKDKMLYLVDQAPFFIGNKWTDFSELSSYYVLSDQWNTLLDQKYENIENKLLFTMNYYYFLFDRIVKHTELIQLFGKRSIYYRNIKRVQTEIEEVKKYLTAYFLI